MGRSAVESISAAECIGGATKIRQPKNPIGRRRSPLYQTIKFNEINIKTNTTMTNEKNQDPRTPWTTPELTTLSVNEDTRQLPPPEQGEQS